jgi:Metal binding domain of Ada
MTTLGRFSERVACRLSVGIVVCSLAAAVGWSAPAPAGETDWPALLQKLQRLDTTKPEAVASLRDVLAEMIRGQQAAAKETALKKELEAKSKEIEALRAEVQALRAQVPVTSATRAYRASTRSKPPAGTAAAPATTRPSAAPGAATAAPAASPAPSGPATAPAATVFFGKKSLKKVHRADCVFGRRIPEADRVYFKSVQEALAAGYEACKVCKPGG